MKRDQDPHEGAQASFLQLPSSEHLTIFLSFQKCQNITAGAKSTVGQGRHHKTDTTGWHF